MASRSVVTDDTPAIDEWRVHVGDTWAKSITYKLNGVAQDVSSWTWLVQMRESQSTTATVLARSDGGTPTITVSMASAASGIVSFTVAASHTATISQGRWWWEFQYTNGTTVRTVMAGPLVVQGDVAA